MAMPPAAFDGLHDSLADRAGRTGDQDDLVLEPRHPPASAVLVVVRMAVLMVVVVLAVLVD